tara:strand:- start:9690 stop:10757 length:1068 start_codon:yes stop_codon:yes gene_type:complete
MANILKRYFKNKKVLITGNTGFKGAWLSFWLQRCGAKVMGISIDEISQPSFFKALNLKKKIKYKKTDIRNFLTTRSVIRKFQPDYIFHLAADAIVKNAFKNPKKAWETNTLGTINILESLRTLKKSVVAVLITSDKVYKNLEINRGYSENDILGGFDPYSASKASADLAIQSYFYSFLKKKKNLKICTARAGNVIGGGDWAEGRIIPDCVRKWSKFKTVKIRNPISTRPWQHVLDVLYGYLVLGIKMKKNTSLNGEVFNFGPKRQNKKTVIEVVKELQKNWKKVKWKIIKKKKFNESNLLQLNSFKAKKKLKWQCKLSFEKAINFTAEWYKIYYFNRKNILSTTLKQIQDYEKLI